jgi:dethiobiotin synthetase
MADPSSPERPSDLRPAIGTAGVFVTGTGTEVGKSVVAAVIARTLRTARRRVAVFKPAVTGLDPHPPGGRRQGPLAPGQGEADHELLRRAAGSSQSDEEIAPYRYAVPASPHLAAALAGETIARRRLLDAAGAAMASADVLVCEGVGGLLVPLSADYLVRDFAADLALPLVIAATPGLGTINHTLLTVEAARAAGLEVAAVVLTPWPRQPSRIEASNRETIGALAATRVETLPPLDLADPASWPSLLPE